MKTDFAQFIHAKIETNVVAMSQQIVRWRHREWPIVFTYGCFDEITTAHVNYLAKAASLGSRLVVGVYSDESMVRLHGHRPQTEQYGRALYLASMVFVSMVVFIDEEYPSSLIQQIRPDALVHDNKNIQNISDNKFTLAPKGITKFFEFNGVL